MLKPVVCPSELRHTLWNPGEINSRSDADARSSRSGTSSRFTLCKRAAPGFSRPALLARARKRVPDIPSGAGAVARAFLSARDLCSRDFSCGAPHLHGRHVRERRGLRLAWGCRSDVPLPRMGILEQLLRANLPTA